MTNICGSYNIYHIIIILIAFSCLFFIMILNSEPSYQPSINITQSPSLNNLTAYSYDNNSLNSMFRFGQTYNIGNTGGDHV